MPRWLIPVGILLVTLALIPFGIIAKARVSTSDKPRIHIIRDMDYGLRYNPQAENTLFADGRAMRAPIPGTVARGELFEDTHYYQGHLGKAGQTWKWATSIPGQVKVDQALLERGRDRFGRFCSMCHGHSGHGDGPVHMRVQKLKLAGQAGLDAWGAPANLHAGALPDQAVGEVFNTISNGKNNMAGYGAQIPVKDRWAIAAYVKALQISQRKK